jgi:tRNA nucleotidyltransferase (CCA-adding enzyme)
MGLMGPGAATKPERIRDRGGLLPPRGPVRDLLERAAALAGRRGERLAWVGGGVRDHLLGRPTVDTDLVVEGDPGGFAADLAAELGGRATAHARFRTATVDLQDGRALDVAGSRKETYATPGALPRVASAPLEDDLARRDFSINAIAVVLAPGPVRPLDPQGGAADLAAGRVRALHAASFRDDPTRLFRGLRFEVRYGYRFDATTEAWARDAIDGGALDTISAERLRRELELACESWSLLSACFARAHDLGLLAAIDRGLGWNDAAAATIDRAARAAELPPVAALGPVRWLVGLLALDPPVEARLRLLRRLALAGREAEVLRSSGARIDAARGLLESRPTPRPHVVARALEHASAEELSRLVAEGGEVEAWTRRYLEDLRPLSLRVRGEDLLRAGFPAGPGIGAALRATLEARQDGVIAAEEELEFARGVVEREATR